MIENLKGIKQCDVCGSLLLLNTRKTLHYYSNDICSSIKDVNVVVDDIIGRYLVYTCVKCGFDLKLTYKNLEMLIRKSLTMRALLNIANGYMSPDVMVSNKFLIFCGKCSGFDGSGGCPEKIYNNCEVKRFPTYGL
jgi:hypothetical protein